MMTCDHCFSKILQGAGDEVKQELHDLTEMEGETVPLKETLQLFFFFSFCHIFIGIEFKKKEMCIA